MVHIDANTKAATILINTGIMAVFHSTKCQRWDYSMQKATWAIGVFVVC